MAELSDYISGYATTAASSKDGYIDATADALGDINSLKGTLSGFVGEGARDLAGAATDALGISDGASNSLGLGGTFVGGLIDSGINAGINAGVDFAEDLASDVIGGLIDEATRALFGGNINALFRYTPNKGFAGLSPEQARRLHSIVLDIDYSMKNLFFIEITDSVLGESLEKSFMNLFVTDIEYTPITVNSDKKQVGSAQIDVLTGVDSMELKITAYDDNKGSIKKWASGQAAAQASLNGTYGVPANYALKIKITHGFIDGDSRGYFDIGSFRLSNLDVSLSRKDEELQEIQISFVQLDTFEEVT